MKFLRFLIFFFSLSRGLSESELEFDDVLCDDELNKFDLAIKNRELWAWKLFDTWAKLPSGLLHGNRKNPGHFTECVKFRHEGMHGQHCMVSAVVSDNQNLERFNIGFCWEQLESILSQNNLKIEQGICLPASCSTRKVIEYANVKMNAVGLKVQSATCRSNDAIPFGTLDFFAVLILALLATALVSSTLYEISTIKNNKVPNKLLTAFSVYSNGARLFDISKTRSPNVIGSLDGIRALSIFWIILGHRFDDRDAVPVYNEDDSHSYVTSLYMFLLHTNYDKPVDTFLLVGGMLACWSFLSAFEKKSVSIPRMYLHRYLRYTPSLALMILVFTSLTKFLASGPFYSPDTGNCEKYWWTALLHVSVYTNPNEFCYGISWYLTVDFQLFLISPLLVYPLWKMGYKFFWCLSFIVFAVQLWIFISTYNSFDAELPIFEVLYSIVRKFYFPTHLRLGEWVVGIMLGYVMYQTCGKKVEIPKVFNYALWTLSLSILYGSIFALYPFQRLESNTTTRMGNALFCATFRIGWGFGVAWLIFACQNGSGGLISWFLSLPQWKPLGRMSLSIYLGHRWYQLITVHDEKQPIYWSFITQVQKVFGDCFVSIFLGALLYLSVENPIAIIENHLHKKHRA